MTYAVNDIYPTIQGEGKMTGTPVVLIRLQGCGVGCPFCDTKETWKLTPDACIDDVAALHDNPLSWAELSADEIVARCNEIAPELTWVMLTGGEPALQPLGKLFVALHNAGKHAMLETSGTALGHLTWGDTADWVCVSPKVGMPGGRSILRTAIKDADEFKFVIARPVDVDAVHEFLSTWKVRSDAIISLQPMSQNEKATELCIKTAIETGWNLSLQMHKYIDIK